MTERVGGGGQSERDLVGEGFNDEVGQRCEEGVGGSLRSCAADWPACRVVNHLAHEWRGGDHACAVLALADHLLVEEHGDGCNVAERRAMRKPGRDPDGLARCDEEAPAIRFDLGDAGQRVLDLVEIVAVPAGREIFAVIDECAGSHASRISHLDGPERGHRSAIFVRSCGDGHQVES